MELAICIITGLIALILVSQGYALFYKEHVLLDSSLNTHLFSLLGSNLLLRSISCFFYGVLFSIEEEACDYGEQEEEEV